MVLTSRDDQLINVMGIIIELKSYGHGQMLEQRVIDLVEAAGSEREVQCKKQ